MPPDLVERRKTDRLFLEQLLDTSKLENYSVPVSIKADLRKYQQVCVRALINCSDISLIIIIGWN